MSETVRCGCVEQQCLTFRGQTYVSIDASACILPAAVAAIRAELARLREELSHTKSVEYRAVVENIIEAHELDLRALGVKVEGE